jgi:hypothetical protein
MRFIFDDLTDAADQIACPTLVCDAENDQSRRGQPAMPYEALHCPKTFLTFTATEGAGERCHERALTLFHPRMFDWPDRCAGRADRPMRADLVGAQPSHDSERNPA